MLNVHRALLITRDISISVLKLKMSTLITPPKAGFNFCVVEVMKWWKYFNPICQSNHDVVIRCLNWLIGFSNFMSFIVTLVLYFMSIIVFQHGICRSFLDFLFVLLLIYLSDDGDDAFDDDFDKI